MSFSLVIRNLMLVAVSLVATIATAAAQIVVPVSGYEIYLGHSCTVAGAPALSATCGATFTGWTGETINGGWLAFPGTGKGVWSIQINYIGHPAFGGTTPQVTVVGGQWSFLFVNGLILSGKVVNGTVTWPVDQYSSVEGFSCGPGVAVAQANLTLVGGKSASVSGCLHDIPAGTVIPPKEWGAFTFYF
jgi:hypothetical protein